LREPPAPQTDDDLTSLRRDYEAPDYLKDAAHLPLVGSVHVEAAHDPADPAAETAWVAQQRHRYGLPTVAVAGVRLQSPSLQATLEAHTRHPFVRGVRQMVNWTPEEPVAERDGLLDDPAWLAGLDLLGRYGLSFDLQVFPHQLHRAAHVAATRPQQLFVLDHGGYCQRRTADRDRLWTEGLTELSALPNVVIKASSYPSIDPSMNPEGLRRFLQIILDAFGPQRTMFASNFPVDGRFTSYQNMVDAYDSALVGLSEQERDAFFHTTAATNYRFPPATDSEGAR